MSISDTQLAAIGGIGLVAAAVIISDDNESGVVPTVQRIVPGSNDGGTNGSVDFDQFTDSTGDVVNTGTDAVDTAVDTAVDAGANIGVDLPDITDPAVTDAVVDSAIDANPAASAVNDVVNIVSGNGNGSGSSDDVQESVNNAFSDFV